jgi:hypothetical protein
MPLERIPEETDILVSDFRADRLSGSGAVLKEFLGCRHPECLNKDAGTRAVAALNRRMKLGGYTTDRRRVLHREEF